MTEAFHVRITVRGYELDTQGHLNLAVYQQYGIHVKWEFLRSAGIMVDDLLGAGVGPVTLETNIRYHAELRGGDEVDVSCAYEWGDGKTWRVHHEFRRIDGKVAATITDVGGLLDLQARRLVAEPGECFRSIATEPEKIGL